VRPIRIPDFNFDADPDPDPDGQQNDTVPCNDPGSYPWSYMEKNWQKLYRLFLSRRSDPDMDSIQVFHIRPGQVSDLTGSGFTKEQRNLDNFLQRIYDADFISVSLEHWIQNLKKNVTNEAAVQTSDLFKN
jgi:hypothetical protein